MLGRLDPAFLHLPARDGLLDFLRHPFTPQSCRRVDAELPEVAPAYRALASTRDRWEGVVQPAMPADAMSVLRPLAEMNGTRLPLMPMALLQAQVVLLQEDLRDHQERASFARGQALRPGGTVATAALALQALALHEAAFLALAGLFRARRTDALVEFALSPLGEACLRDRVHSATLQNFTDASVRAAIAAAADTARGAASRTRVPLADAVTPAQLDALESRLLDAGLSLSSHMQADPVVRPLIAGARRMCRWMAMLELMRLAGEPVLQPDATMSSRLGLDPALPGAIIRERARALTSDKGIVQTPSGGLTLGDSSLGHAMSCCKGAVLASEETRLLGEHFERHVRSYVRHGVPASDYVVRDGFKASGKARLEGASYDCDLILFEPERQKIFFVQVKWKRDSRTANLDDELNEWRARNSSLTHGVSQLKALRDRLAEPRVIDQIRSRLPGIRLSDDRIAHHSHFIVVHTLPYFNAYMNDGVALYEWNFFRNLLLRGVVQRAQAPVARPALLRQLPAASHHETLPLEDPGRALDFFHRSLGADLAEMPRLMEARAQARYGFDVQRHDDPGWRRLLAPRSWRVVRPYL